MLLSDDRKPDTISSLLCKDPDAGGNRESKSIAEEQLKGSWSTANYSVSVRKCSASRTLICRESCLSFHVHNG